MKKDRKLVVGNWKMNPGTLEEAKRIYGGIKKKKALFSHTDIVMCPPSIFIAELKKTDRNKDLLLGAQNVFHENIGAFTGEIGPALFRDSGAEYTLVGHSERRLRGESDEDINKKVNSALKEGLKVILCIGEKERDLEGEYLSFIKNQLRVGLDKVNKKILSDVVIAYEPVWAIGKSDSEAMKGKDVHEMAIFIRKTLSEMYSPQEVLEIKILYGGSVSALNAQDIVGESYVDGLLVGRQSLSAEAFVEIIQIVDNL